LSGWRNILMFRCSILEMFSFFLVALVSCCSHVPGVVVVVVVVVVVYMFLLRVAGEL